MNLIEILFRYLRELKLEVEWIVQGLVFTFPIVHKRIGRAKCVVRQENNRVFIEVGLVRLDELADVIGCVSKVLIDEQSPPDNVLFYVFLQSLENPSAQLLGIRTYFDHFPNSSSLEDYIPCFNSCLALTRHHISELDGLLTRLSDECRGNMT